MADTIDSTPLPPDLPADAGSAVEVLLLATTFIGTTEIGLGNRDNPNDTIVPANCATIGFSALNVATNEPVDLVIHVDRLGVPGLIARLVQAHDLVVADEHNKAEAAAEASEDAAIERARGL